MRISPLRRQQALNAALVGIALALVVMVAATRDRLTTTLAEAREDNLLVDFHEEAITRIRLERKEGSFTLARSGGDGGGDPTWSLTEPVEESAEVFAVQKILGTLEFASAVRRIKPEEVNRAAFGLDSPEWVVHVDMGDVKYRLRAGKEAASPAGARYLEVAGEGAPSKGVVLIGKSLSDEFSVRVEDFRERYVMPYLSTGLESIVLEGEGGVRRLRRADWSDGWRFAGMLGDARLGRASLNRLLTQFARTRAERFIDFGVAERTLAGTPAVTVTMKPLDRAKPEGVVQVGGKCPESDTDIVAVRRSPDRLAACVPKSVLAGLGMPAEALIDRTLFWMRPDEVEGFEIRSGEERLALERKGEGFVMRAPREASVDPEAGNGRLEALLRAGGVVLADADPKGAGLDPPQGTVVVKSTGAKESAVRTETVLVGRPGADGRVYVQRKHDGVVLELGREAARVLVADSSLVRSRTLLDVSLIDVTGVDVDGEIRQSVTRSGTGAFTLTSPPGYEVDGSLGLELSDALRTLRAERWVTDRDDGTFGLGAPTVTARLSVKKDEQTTVHVLRLGRAAGSGNYASLEGTPGVFVVPRRLRETLTTWVLDRSAMTMDPASTAEIRLETPERTVVLEKRGDDFVQTDPGEPLSPESVQRLVETLSGMRAEAALAVGPPRTEAGLASPVLVVRLRRAAGQVERAESVLHFGSGDSWRGIAIHYARVEGTPVTYGVARSAVRALLDAL